MIDWNEQLSVTRQAQLLGISRGSVYYLPRPVSEADLAFMRRIDELHLEHPFMGARKLRDQQHREGIKVGRKHIGTLMQRMGITALAPQPATSKLTPSGMAILRNRFTPPTVRAGNPACSRCHGN